MRTILLTTALALGVFACNPNRSNTKPVCRNEIAKDAAGPASARIFAIGLKQELASMRSLADYRAWIEKAVEQEAPCFSKHIPNLLVFPEDAALVASFVGSRGNAARQQTQVEGAFAKLFISYAKPLKYYRERYPGTPPLRALLLAMTDLLGRAVEETYPVFAQKYGVYIATSLNVARYEKTRDPELVNVLGDPDDPERKEAFVATSNEVYNWSIVWGPDGREIGRVRKAYLTPPEEDLLQLNYGTLEQLRPIATPIGRLAPVISKDAWMPDVLERFNDLDAEITLQHEAFSGWAIEEHAGDWLPDVVMESHWNHLQAYDSLRFDVFPCLSGNLLTMVYDCQSSLSKESAPNDQRIAYIGRDSETGFLDIGAWVIEDPSHTNPSLSVAERRSMLRKKGEALRPGGAEANAYVATVARGDVALLHDPNGLPMRRTAAQIPAEGEMLVSPPDPVAVNQIRPALAVSVGRVHVAWLEDRANGRVVRYATGDTADLTLLSQTLDLGAQRPYGLRITATGDRVYVVAVDDLPGGHASRLILARSVDAGASWQRLSTSFAGDGEWARWNPALAADGNSLAVVWADRRAGSTDIYLALSHDAGETFSLRRIDEPHANADIANNAANTRNNQALPDISIQGNLMLVTWADFRAYAWDIYAAMSTDGGVAWTENFRVNPSAPLRDGVETERIWGINRNVILGDSAIVVYEGLDDRGPFRRVAAARICLRLCTTSRTEPLVFAAMPAGYRPTISLFEGSAVVLWQDMRNLEGDIYVSRLTTDGWTPAAAVTTQPGMQFNPQISAGIAVWEDWSLGHGRIVLRKLD